MLQRIERRPHHVVRVGRSDRLRDNVLHPEHVEYGAHRAARDNARAGRRRAQKHFARTMAAEHVVMQRAALAQRHADQVPLSRIRRLADRLRHLARLAMAVPDTALLVADDHERRETETPAAFHHLGNTVDMDELVYELARLFPLPGAGAFALVWFTCHR